MTIEDARYCMSQAMNGLCGRECPLFTEEQCVPPDEEEFKDHPCKKQHS